MRELARNELGATYSSKVPDLERAGSRIISSFRRGQRGTLILMPKCVVNGETCVACDILELYECANTGRKSSYNELNVRVEVNCFGVEPGSCRDC